MRICYLILIHHKFSQARRLIERLATGGSSFVVHVDAAADPTAAKAFRDLLTPFQVAYAPPVRVTWGSYRQALAIVRCLQTALGVGSFDRYCLLSGQDYPIASNRQIFEFFEQHTGEEYIEAHPQDLGNPEEPGWSSYYRFRRFHLWFGKHHREVPLLRKGLPPSPIHHGSTWWALTGAAVRYVAGQFEANRALRNYMKTGFLVDEAYVPSIMMNSPFASRVTGSNVTYARWTPTSGPHPAVLGADNLQELLASKKLFARKFDSDVDPSILDELDRRHAQTIAVFERRVARVQGHGAPVRGKQYSPTVHHL